MTSTLWMWVMTKNEINLCTSDQNFYAFLISPIRAASSAHIILVDLVLILYFVTNTNYGATHYELSSFQTSCQTQTVSPSPSYEKPFRLRSYFNVKFLK